MKMKWLSLIGLLMVGASAMAQNPNSAQNHAIRNPNSPYSPYPNAQQPSQPQVNWANRWGAIAAGKGENAIYGIVADMSNKRKARKAAIEDCKERGGADCKLVLTYFNQCAVVSAGSAGTFPNTAATIEQATQDAIQRCETATGKGSCWIYYSGCSLPAQVQ